MAHRGGHLMRAASKHLWVASRTGVRSIGLIAALLALISLAATECGDAIADQSILTGEGAWVLESLNGQPVIENSFVMMSVKEERLEGFDGCNRYGGRSADGALVVDANGKFSAPPIGGTDIGCNEPEGVLDQAKAYISTLMRMDRLRVSGDRLEALDRWGAARLVFVRQVPLPGNPIDLRGTGWRLLRQGDARAATMSFLDERVVTGVTACRPYLATYLGTGGNVRFPSKSMLTSTHSCPDDARLMEGEFTDFLTWAREYAVSDREGLRLLRMRSSRGKTLTFEPLSPAVQDIANAEWILVSFVELRDEGSGTWNARTTRAVQGIDVTISFDEDGISGSSGCNSYSSQATAEDGVITIDVQSYSHTEKLCEEREGLMEQGERFLDLLPRLERYGINGNGMFLHTDDDVFLLFSTR